MNSREAILAHYKNVLAQCRHADDSLYLCRACNTYGPADVTLEVEPRDDLYDRPPTLDVCEIKRCAACASEDVDVAQWCELCNERPANEPGTDMCHHCFEANEAEQDATVAEAKALEAELNRGWPQGEACTCQHHTDLIGHGDNCPQKETEEVGA